MNTLEVITRAMRRLGVLAGGELPRNDEAADALATLIALYQRFITDGAFGEIADIIASGPIVAGENQRIVRDTLDDTSITLPDTITEDGRSRPPRDLSVVIISDVLSGQTVEYIFDGAAKAWIRLDGLTLTSVAPLARRDALGLACYLAVELADEFGQQPSEITVRNAVRFQTGLTQNWSNATPTAKGVYF